MSLTAYQQCEQQFAQMSRIQGIAALLGWDAAVYLPDGAADVRSSQLEWLAQQSHALMVDARMKDWLDEAQQQTQQLDTWQRANLKEMQHAYVHANCMDASLVGALAKTASESERVWRAARKDNDFNAFAPSLEKMIGLVRESAQVKAQALGLSPYDALLDSYDASTRSADIDVLFAELEAFLPDFVEQVITEQARRPLAQMTMKASQAKQKKLARMVMESLGFPFEHGRLDTSTHPFCGGIPDDIRITTRYNPEDFTESLFGVLHETGHALYEAGLPKQWRDQPVGQARGMSAHESQSLFVEMQVAQSRAYCEFLAPLIQRVLGMKDVTADALYQRVTHVERSFIRVCADEVTYPAHILLRYRLEKALLSGDLLVRDLPAAWGDGMQSLLGVRPTTDTEGCLQDIHWPEGAIGYFPTYTLGAMMAAQWMEAARNQLPDVDARLRAGDMSGLRHWLREAVHTKASSVSAQELLVQATGKPLSAECYIRHLKTRYLPEGK
jgi:carboxypeptidase Taq